MIFYRRLSILLIIMMIAVSSCNLPTTQGNNEPPDLEATITAQALLLLQPAPLVDNFTPIATSTITPTFTPSVPMVTVSQDTNCRTGPSKDYDYLALLKIGQTAEVIGKNTANNYWIVNIGGITCWLWGQYATVSGNTAVLAEYVVPPSPTPSLPAQPNNFKVHISCAISMDPFLHNEVHIELEWVDLATNEEGYKVYRDGAQLATLGENATSFSDDTSLPAIFIFGDPPPSVEYSILAFNGAGKSNDRSKSVTCP